MSASREMASCGGRKVTTFHASTALSHDDRDEHVEMVRNALLSRKHKIEPAAVTTIDGEELGRADTSLRKRRLDAVC